MMNAPIWRAGAKPPVGDVANSTSLVTSKAPAHEPPWAAWYANAVARIATSISSEPTRV